MKIHVPMQFNVLFRWTHFEQAAGDNEIVASTNSSEGLNQTLNDGIRYAESFIHQISIYKRFKIRQIERYFDITSNTCWVPGRRPKVIERHQRLNDLVGEFMNMGVINQHDVLLEVARAVGQLMSKNRN